LLLVVRKIIPYFKGCAIVHTVRLEVFLGAHMGAGSDGGSADDGCRILQGHEHGIGIQIGSATIQQTAAKEIGIGMNACLEICNIGFHETHMCPWWAL
jgi:hypothetical protein